MKNVKLISWNVNGIRSVANKGLLEFLYRESPDALCLQETKASPDQLSPEVREPRGYTAFWNMPLAHLGYSGVVTYAREKPVSVMYNFGDDSYDVEGRVAITAHPEFRLFNIYFPNGKQSDARLSYNMDFYDRFLDFADSLKANGEKLVICGDYNTAHHEIDIARPKENAKFSGFLPSERAWMDKLVAHGYRDAFRHFNKEPGHYTYWDIKSGARARNVGWRIDYFFVSENLVPAVTGAAIMSEVTGSDHCPITLTLRFD